MRHTISVLVENEFGVLARVAGLFAGRGYNIQSLSVAETLDPHISRITMVTTGNDAVIEQTTKQLNKLVNVLKVQDLTKENPINRILALVKVSVGPKSKTDFDTAVKSLGAEVLDADSRYSVIEVRGDEEKIAKALKLLKPLGITELVQTGNISIQRGKATIDEKNGPDVKIP